jgi:hypothetical protein
MKGGFQQFDVFVQRAKKGLQPACNLNGASHEGFGGSGFKILPTDEGYTSALARGHLKAYLKGAEGSRMCTKLGAAIR